MGDLEGSHGRLFVRIFDLLQDSERLERRDHRLFASKTSAACVCTEFPIAGICRNDNGAENHENNFKEIDEDDVTHRAAASLPIATHAGDGESENSGEEHYEGVDDALKKGHGHHIAIGDVADFMAENSFHFCFFHAREKTCGDGNERAALRWSCSKCVHFIGTINAHFRHGGEAGFACEPMHGVEKVSLIGIFSVQIDDLYAHHPFRHLARKREGNKRAAHSPNKTENENETCNRFRKTVNKGGC